MPAIIIAYDPRKPWLGGNIQGGDPMTFCPPVWDFLIEKFSPQSICDVGCGEGHLMEYFLHKNIAVTGIDGLPENKLNGVPCVKDRIIIHDYQERYPEPLFYDMVLSCEFVEHVDEEYCINYFDQFQKCKILAFTHAMPDQHGHHHVNCQNDMYWINMMSILHFNYLGNETRLARKLAGETFWNTVLIFKNKKA